MTTARPNLLLIQADQLKPQVLPSYGGPADAPHLQRLGEEGIVFENAYCNFPLCAPSRFSMLSGMLPSRIGAFDNGAEFPAQTPTVAHYLSLAGYRTSLAGKQHFVGPDMLHGFHERLLPELYPTDFSWTPSWDEVRMDSNNNATGVTRAGVCARSVQMDHDEAVLYRARSRLHDFARDGDQPFFLVASFTHPHEPYYCQQRHWDRYRHEDVPMPATPLQPEPKRSPHTERLLRHHSLLDPSIDEAAVRRARHGYLGSVSCVDDMVGDLLDTLDVCRLRDNTIIVVTSDHGDMLGEHGLWFKKAFFDDCTRVPLIINAPTRFAPTRRADNVSLVDLVPTLCGLAGVDAHERSSGALDGASLVPLMTSAGEGAPAREAPVLAEITSEGVPCPMFMVRLGRHKLLTGGGVPSQLFDMVADRHERNDLAADPASTDTLARLEQEAATRWDAEALDARVRTSQRWRRLVEAAHQAGRRPDWDVEPGDPTRRWLLRSDGGYNDWAWQGLP